MWVITVYGCRRSTTSSTAPNKCCELCFRCIKIVSKRLTLQLQSRLTIYYYLLLESSGSILNGLFNSLAYEPKPSYQLEATIVIIFGDVLGQIVLMLLFFSNSKIYRLRLNKITSNFQDEVIKYILITTKYHFELFKP